MESPPFAVDDFPDLAYLKMLLANGGMWYKMDKAEGVVSIENAKARAMAGDKTDVRNIAARVELRDFCRDVIADIEQILGPRNRKGLGKLGTTRRLPHNAVTRLQHGVISGSLPIRAKMRHLAGKPNPPVGLIDRLTIVGWWP